MYIFGIDVPILELLVIFSIVVVIYLVILEIEFRQLRRITRKFDEEEITLSKEMRELKDEISTLREVIGNTKLKASK
jgi:Zn-dependent membrane protease YugP